MKKTKTTKTFSEVTALHRSYLRTAFAGRRDQILYFTQEHDGSLLAFSKASVADARQQMLNRCYGTKLPILTYHKDIS